MNGTNYSAYNSLSSGFVPYNATYSKMTVKELRNKLNDMKQSGLHEQSSPPTTSVMIEVDWNKNENFKSYSWSIL